MKTKRCSICHENKPLDAFTKDRSRPDGLRVQCRVCLTKVRPPRGVRAAQNEAKKKHTEKPCTTCGQVKPMTAFYRCDNVDGRQGQCKKCVAAYNKTMQESRAAANAVWRKNNIERAREQEKKRARRYLATKPGLRAKKLQYRRDWGKKNRDITNAHRDNYEARKKGNGGTHTTGQWKSLCVRYGNTCLCCGGTKPLTKDHVVPVSRGGCNDISNIQPLCRSCNSSKREMIIDFRGDKSSLVPTALESISRQFSRFAATHAAGLDVSSEGKDRVRGAVGMLLGKRIESRAELTAAEWAFCANAVRMQKLFW
jgi:hypothetical protein